jgi:protein Mpv17
MSSVTLARVYRRSFEAYPHVTLAVAGGALTALGDAVAQFSQWIVRFLPHTHSLTLTRI